jgi:hypothetical protein
MQSEDGDVRGLRLRVPTAEDTIAILDLIVAALALPDGIGHEGFAAGVPGLPSPST